MIKLSKKIQSQVLKIILDYKKPGRIVLFGSRASGFAGKRSDIDLAIVAAKWGHKDISVVHDLLEETIPTALKFDVVDFCRLKSGSLKKDILLKGKVIYES